jgi:hypothetical protein
MGAENHQSLQMAFDTWPRNGNSRQLDGKRHRRKRPFARLPARYIPGEGKVA